MTKEELLNLINLDNETEHLEFKSAEKSFNFNNGRRSICGYCVALANEMGGKIILGVSDQKPRKITGTKAFPSISKLQKDLFGFWNRKVEVEEFEIEGKRVLVINIPSRSMGEPLQFEGQYLMRVNDRLESMNAVELKKIFNEIIPDFSAKTINSGNVDDLSEHGLKELRKLLKRSGRFKKNIDDLDDIQLLKDLNLIQDNRITLAAIILLGSQSSQIKYLPYSEIRYGYKSNEEDIRNQDTVIFNGGYLTYYNQLWEKIDSKNMSLHIPQGFLLTERKAFEEETIREAINNSIIHRDYFQGESTFVFQTQFNFSIKSPGGFPLGVTQDNILDESKVRNKLIADTLYKCEFVEQFGNGVNLMFRNQLRLGKKPPGYSLSDNNHVFLTIDGLIQDVDFAKYVFNVADKKQKILSDKELITLYDIFKSQKIKYSKYLPKLVDLGLIEKYDTRKYVLSKAYYDYSGKPSEYTRKIGLDKNTNKALIIEHLKKHNKGIMKEFMYMFRTINISKITINRYLTELKKENKVEFIGNPRIYKGDKKGFWQIKK